MSKFKSRYPVSERCPQCGDSEYKAREPETYIAFVSDRECKACQTRYTPPTPRWAAMVFILLGVLAVALDVTFHFLPLMRPGMGTVSSFQSRLAGAMVGLFGIVCIVHGVQSMKNFRGQNHPPAT